MRFVLALGAAAAVALVAWLRPAAPPGPPAPPPSWSTAPPAPARSASLARAVVYVAGAVVRPGVYTLRTSARVVDALAQAGGARPDADLVAVNLAAPLRDGDEIAVPVRGAAPPPHPRRSSGPRRASRVSSRRATQPLAALDLNRAPAVELATIPGIGPELARRIVAFRELNGPFEDPEELLDVAGISEQRLAELSPYIFVR